MSAKHGCGWFSDGGRFRWGSSARIRCHSLSSLQAKDGSQANPASTITILSLGKRSKIPSNTMLDNIVWQD